MADGAIPMAPRTLMHPNTPDAQPSFSAGRLNKSINEGI